MLSLVEEASDTALLDSTELRTAVGVTDSSHDGELDVFGSRVSAAIARYCRVASADGLPPTLRLETVSQTFRLHHERRQLVLARRPVSEIVSITVADTALETDEWEVNKSSGILTRLSDDSVMCWPCGKIVVVFSAGFDDVPDDLKMAASRLLKGFWTASTRDPNLKRTMTEGVGEREYWVPPTTDPAIPSEVADLLRPYVNQAIG